MSKCGNNPTSPGAVAVTSEEFRLLADNMPVMCWIANASGYVYWYNRRWYEYTGTTPAAMQGWGWQEVHDPAILPEVLRRWDETIRTRRPFDMEFPLRGADGRYRRFLTRAYPLRDEAGQVVEWFGTNT